MKIGHELANFFSGIWATDLKPWLHDLLTQVEHDVVDALVPIGHEAVQEVLNEGGQLLAGASLATVATSTGVALVKLAQKAESAGIQASGRDLLTALAGVLATRQAQGG